MDKIGQFNIVFTKLHEILEEKSPDEAYGKQIEIIHSTEVSPEEIDEIANLRQIVTESTEPKPISFTTT